jgi:hypothetical protein
MDGLAQYGVGNGWLDPSPIFHGLTIDPPNPFSEAQLRKLLTDLIDWPVSAGSLPDPAGSLADLPTDPQMRPWSSRLATWGRGCECQRVQ